MTYNNTGAKELVVEIPESFDGFLDAALTRLRIHFSSMHFSLDDLGICVSSAKDFDSEAMRSSVLHIVYREKIYTETLSMREQLLSAVMR